MRSIYLGHINHFLYCASVFYQNHNYDDSQYVIFSSTLCYETPVQLYVIIITIIIKSNFQLNLVICVYTNGFIITGRAALYKENPSVEAVHF